MSSLTLYSDPLLGPKATQLLRDATAEHRLITPTFAASSVLAQPAADPAFEEAEIAFGQPHLENIYTAKKLRWIHISSAGFTRYDTPEFRAYAENQGLIVTNSSTVYSRACAEHVFSFMLAQSRLLPQALASHAENGSEEWSYLRSGCKCLFGQNVVILGYGAIASELVKLLAPFEMNITAMRRTPRGNEGFPVVTEETLPFALADADHVINILPENAASRGFVNAALLSHFKTGAVFHNIGRGATVNQQDLADALHSGKLAAAWLDVTDPEPLPADHPLRHAPNCHITPHIAGGHAAEDEALVRHFLTNLHRYLAGVPLLDRLF
ncbi:MAG: D-2-hydroxyacid dehydrogenase [Luteolibacter sp.]